jgi:N-glycosylase/DNA lyase
MVKPYLPVDLLEKYHSLKDAIINRLNDFKKVPESDYFYELCYCLCTPQSKAENAMWVQKKLQEVDFYNKPFNPINILSDKLHYIRFHNTKSIRIIEAREQSDDIIKIIKEKTNPQQTRINLSGLIRGLGTKESSHFLRNIGFCGLAILDRHILKHLALCNIIDEIPKTISFKRYIEIEKEFLTFAENVKIPIDELDLLFWSYETGKILK